MDLFNKKVISDQERDTAIAAAQAGRANVEADEAAVQQAQLNLGYTKILAPIEGVSGFANNQVGDLVGPTTDRSPRFHKSIRSKPSSPPAKGHLQISFHDIPIRKSATRMSKALQFELILGNGEVYPQKGKFYALDRSLDLRTGSIRYEVTFPNPGDTLRPGQFGKVRFVADMKKGAMVIPQEAVTELQGSYQVAVVGDDNKVSIRPVQMGERIGAMWEVTQGLKPGDKVVVQGLQKVREGSTVTVKEWSRPADALISKVRSGKGALINVGVFRQAADCRDRHRDFDDAHRRRVHSRIADRAVSANRATGDSGANALHRGGCADD